MVTDFEKIKSPQEVSKELRESIYKAKKQIEKQADNLKELFTLIRKHPDLPIVAMAVSYTHLTLPTK